MQWLWAALPALACAAMMLLICVPMMMGHKHKNDSDGATPEDLKALREELAALKAEGASPEATDHDGNAVPVGSSGQTEGAR